MFDALLRQTRRSSIVIGLLCFALLGSGNAADWELIQCNNSRVPLASNTSKQIYQEFHDGTAVIPFIRDINIGASVVFGGSDDHYTLAVLIEPDSKGREQLIKRIRTYAFLRWRGVSPSGSIDLAMEKKLDGMTALEVKDAKLATDTYPGLPVIGWKPIDSAELAALPWLGKQTRTYAIIDKEIALLLTIPQPNVCILYVVDALEFGPQAHSIRSAALKIYLDPKKKQNGAAAYWKKLEDELSSQGILWRSPRHLNPDTVWD